jgi:hypothetical protein
MRVLAAIIGALLLVPIGWLTVGIGEELWSTWTYRYRLTLSVLVDGEPRTGTGVLQVRVTQKSRLLPQSGGVSTSVSGEAVIVDLGSRGMLFALLKDVERPFVASGMWLASADNIVQSAFPRVKGEEGEQGLALSLQRYARGGEKTELSPDQLPLLVRFRDIDNPKTVERVDPHNLAASYGSGVYLKGAAIETVPMGWLPFDPLGWASPRWLTGTPVTRSVATKLPWINEHYSNQLDGERYGTAGAKLPLANSLSSGYFKAGK